jgi:dienelactone hydrolase
MNRREWFRYTVAAWASCGVRAWPAGGAQEKALAGDAMIRDYLAAETQRLSAKFLDGAATPEVWAKVRPRLKQEFLYMLGLDPWPEKTPLRATVTGTLDGGDVVVEKLHYQSRPGLYVTANLWRPKTVAKGAKLPAILYVCGHSNRGRDGNKTAYQDHGRWFASNGYVCLTVDTLQLGEIAGIHHGTYREGRWWWHSRGYTPAGVECWNGIRGIDYLCSLPYVDADKIGVTGISGGGATTNWVIAADERVKVAVPVSGVSDLECYVTDQVINGHCDCMFFHNLYQWEWTTALALFAPKPLLFANSDNDRIFPMSGNKRIIRRLRQCYAMLGAKDNVDEYVSKGGHAYREDLRIAIFQFFHTHLKGDTTAVKDADFKAIAGKELRVFPDDQDLPADAINAKADETFVPVAKVEQPTAKNFPEWKAGLLKSLREKVFRHFPEKLPAATRLAMRDDYETEPGIVCTLQRLGSHEGQKGFTYLVLNPDEKPDEAGKLWQARCPEDRLEVFFPRGSGPRAWTRKNPPNTVERSLVLLGQTVDSGRVRDIVALINSHRVAGRVKLVGTGPAGILAAYAALFVPEASRWLSEILIADPPTTHRDGPHFLNVLRVLDIPEALGLLAPDIQLTLIGPSAKAAAFDRTAAIYAAAGAKDRFRRA